MMVTLAVFVMAVVLWVCTPLDDTFVAVAAVVALLLFGVLPASALAVLGGSTTWLLIAAFVLACGVTASGLPARLAGSLISRARTVRGLFHLVALALLLTAFFVPSTSGRAALALPVFGALSERLDRRVTRALGVLFPSVILLTAVATLVGAGAHLITSSLLESATGQGIGFGQWLLLGLPLAVVSAHLTAEIVLWLFTTRADRSVPLDRPVTVTAPPLPDRAGAATIPLLPVSSVPPARPAAASNPSPPDSAPLDRPAAATIPLDRPAASATALPNRPAASATALPDRPAVATIPLPPARSPATTPLPAASAAARSEGPLQGVPCSHSPSKHRQLRPLARLRGSGLSRAEITALATVLTVSALWLTEPWHGLRPEITALAGAIAITTPRLGTTTLKRALADVPWDLLVFMAATTALGTALVKSGAAQQAAHLISTRALLPTVIAVSLLAHLVIQSRSARSSVLVPIVIPLAAAAGFNPAALAFASTAAAGFCHTLTSSAKPVALFSHAYRPSDLLKLSAVLAPVTALLVWTCATRLWPHLGLPLH